MKVHRIITTIEVENDNSITSVELTNLHLDNLPTAIVITDINSNGSSDDITKVYNAVDDCRVYIAVSIKGIADDINSVLTEGAVRGESSIEPDGASKTN